MAPAILQRAMDENLQGIPHVVCYLDDILVTRIDDNDHLNNLGEIPTRLELQGVRLKKFKYTSFSNAVEYLGHKIGANGIHIAPLKTKVIEMLRLLEIKNKYPAIEIVS